MFLSNKTQLAQYLFLYNNSFPCEPRVSKLAKTLASNPAGWSPFQNIACCCLFRLSVQTNETFNKDPESASPLQPAVSAQTLEIHSFGV